MEEESNGENEATAERQPSPKPPPKNDEGCGLENDPELNELLDSSLADFGKHVLADTKPPETFSSTASDSKNQFTSLLEGLRGLEEEVGGGTAGGGEQNEEQLMKEMEEVFGEEFAKQAEAQLTEAMKMLEMDNPELMKQFEELARTVGLEENKEKEEKEHTSQQTSRKGLEEDSPSDGSKTDSIDHTLQSAVEDTVRRIQASTQGVPTDMEGIEGLSSRLSDMMGNLDIGENGEGEEQVLKMMEDMMNTLLSREVLYPSLVDFCKQYPEWMDRHKDTLSPEDKTRYNNQLRIMQSICVEFEKEDGQESTVKERQDRILKLMQELQLYGQPPEDLGGMPLSQMGLPSSILPSMSDNSQCSLM